MLMGYTLILYYLGSYQIRLYYLHTLAPKLIHKVCHLYFEVYKVMVGTFYGLFYGYQSLRYFHLLTFWTTLKLNCRCPWLGLLCRMGQSCLDQGDSRLEGLRLCIAYTQVHLNLNLLFSIGGSQDTCSGWLLLSRRKILGTCYTVLGRMIIARSGLWKEVSNQY